MSSISQTLLASLVVVLVAMLVLWLVSIAKREASIVDPFWGIGFVLVAWMALGLNLHFPQPLPRRSMLLAMLTTAWG